MIGTETLRALVSAGMSAEQILAVSEAMDRDSASGQPTVDEQAERRRAADRERKRERRSLRNVCGMSADPPPNDIYSNPPPVSSDANASSVRQTPDETEQVAEAWNAMAASHDLPKVAKLTLKRRKACRARLRDDGLAAIQAAIQRIPTIPFLLGENERGWSAHFDFLIKPDTVTSIIEGKYDGKQPRISGLQRSDPLRDELARLYAEDGEATEGDLSNYPGAFSAIPAH